MPFRIRCGFGFSCASSLFARRVSVADLSTFVGASRPTVSKHLGVLCTVGMLERRRVGRSVYYGGIEAPTRKMLRAMIEHLVLHSSTR